MKKILSKIEKVLHNIKKDKEEDKLEICLEDCHNCEQSCLYRTKYSYKAE